MTIYGIIYRAVKEW